MKHTKGEWKIDKWGHIIANGKTLLVTGVALPGQDTEESLANTKLIAATKPMIETLLFMSYRMQEETTVMMITAIQQAIGWNFVEQSNWRKEAKEIGFREAIKKATQ